MIINVAGPPVEAHTFIDRATPSGGYYLVGPESTEIRAALFVAGRLIFLNPEGQLTHDTLVTDRHWRIVARIQEITVR